MPPSLADRRVELGVTGEKIPAEWEATIAACLAKEPQDRPQSAGEVLERLRIGEGGLRSAPAPNRAADNADRTDTAKRAASVAPAQSTVRNPKSAMAKLAIAGGLAGLALAGWYFLIHVPEQQRQVERARWEAQRAAMEAERQRAEAEALRLRQEQERSAASERVRLEAQQAQARQEAEARQRALREA
ncbi:MAG: hypothetical protein RLZZ129_1171 [Verrucomicrobiota bacterium]